MDHRERSHYPAGITEDHERMVLVIDIDYVPMNENDICPPEYDCELEAEYGVCPDCEGKGKYVNPSIDSHGLTSEDFDEDPDFLNDYLGGMYDITCRSCGGRRVILVPISDEGKKIVDEIIQEDRNYQMEIAAERRACGYY